ncbi:LemA family protein [Parabacteroides faecis]|jgi:lemA protein|uniref:LemA protein n=1 Tax=Parabacteroides faecis TaxID=1217282 RepID=A0ABR6KQJ8_9BACT|nr:MULTISPECIES: LemA family protein [Parabacteroides]MBB4623648.1 LemA protein [Parabacteroides faecis]MBC8620125.1 LemA family protein [Parabacteroides faecis]MCS2893399.1 LemA family protein [Parabacteroides faecis]RHR43337.1 LemA family protein [Parabacteroides sp. AF18-52]RHR91535.1 LemA family protein [Parabacteroides sp. AF14-59]
MFKNKALWITLAIIVVLLFAGYSWVKSTYNTMVTQDEGVKTAWSQVENQYQRRMDLIPNLVNTVKGYATHEKETLEGVVSARAEATKTTIDPSNLNEESMKKFQAAQGELSSALSRLMVVLERYPDLKANQNFSELQAQLEGTENRISVERKRFNETAQTYNTYIRSFPTNILAGMFGFQPKAYFSAESGAEKAPKVEF